MSSEPQFLAHLGEFATLRNAIGSWYHQDTYDDFADDREIWADIYSGHDENGRRRLETQIVELLRRSDQEVLALWNSESHAQRYDNGHEVRAFLDAMLGFFKEHTKQT